MRTPILMLAAAAAFTLAAPAGAAAQGPPEHAQAQKEKPRGQGQGQEKPRGQPQEKARGQGQGQARGQAQAVGRGEAPGRSGAARGVGRRGGPAPDRAAFHRNLVENAIRTRAARRADAPDVRVRREGGEVRVTDAGGRLLFALAPETVDDLGYWRAAVVPPFRDGGWRDPAGAPRTDGRTQRRVDLGGIFGDGGLYPDDDRDRDAGSPAFCRSGAGHPVWGRDWCLDKGFGLGDDRGRWAVDRDIEDIIFRRPDPRRDVLDRGGLLDVLGDVVFGRLALQSLVLGAEEPLAGRWLAPADGPRTLRVHAGDLPVAELVDYDRDDQVDTIVFNLGG